jgi:N-formylglutamate amidohydrolase
MKRFFITVLLSMGSLASFAQTVAALQMIDKEGWTAYLKGTMPLVISVPHGGTLNLGEVADRSCEGAVTVTDSYTKELALEIADQLQKFKGQLPYLVICNLIRKDIDQNRDKSEATCGDSRMEGPWEVFHSQIDDAIDEAILKFGHCIYIDLHGHGHPEQRLELGYMLSDKELKEIYQTKQTPAKQHSLSNYLTASKGTLELHDLLFGPEAFGTLMAKEGFPSVPSAQDPFPQEGQKYFNGGYNTRRYTATNRPQVVGWQIESNMKGVRDKAGRPVFAAAFTKVITQYIDQVSAHKK